MSQPSQFSVLALQKGGVAIDSLYVVPSTSVDPACISYPLCGIIDLILTWLAMTQGQPLLWDTDDM